MNEVNTDLIPPMGSSSIDTISSEEKTSDHHKYFGNDARASFFERYRWLNRQSEITLSDIRQPFDIQHLNFPSVQIPELDLHDVSNRDTPISTARQNDHEEVHHSSKPELPPLKRPYRGRISTDQSVDYTSSELSTADIASVASRGSKASTRSSMPNIHTRRPTRNTKSRVSLPALQGGGKGGSDSNQSVASRRSYLSSRSRASFAPGPIPSSSNDSLADDMDLMSELFPLYNLNDDFASQDDQDLQLISPRTKFLASCLKDKINPRASLLVRKKVTTKLDLKHQGMNDQLAKSFAKSLQDMPALESINLTDNRLTDIGLTTILHAIGEMSGLKELNLSQNKMGVLGARALKDYLSSDRCVLEQLILNNTDVDDSECAQFVYAIEKHASSRLIELDLSHNALGKTEKILTSRNSITTPRSSLQQSGTHAIAQLLQSPHCRLQRLNLEWNLIRLEGATVLMKSLAFNTTLLHINLSYNTLSAEAGVVLGQSLLKNSVLTSLDLSYTSIDAIGCISICAGILESKSLEKVVLDGNPIGDQGGKAVLITTIFLMRPVELSSKKCNITIKDAKCWFDFDNLGRDYCLNLEQPFDRAVSIFLLHILAGHPMFRFAKVSYEAMGKGGKGDGKLKPITLVAFDSHLPERSFNDKQQQQMASLQRIQEAAGNYKSAVTLFEETDTDGSGVLEFPEFHRLMQKLGVDFSEKRLKQLMKKYDHDNSGTIDLTNFLMLLRHQRRECASRMEQMKTIPILVQSEDLQTHKNNSSNSQQTEPPRYLPPETGFFHALIVSDLDSNSGEHWRVLTSYHCDVLIKTTQHLTGNNLLASLTTCLEMVKIRYNEAIMLADIMLLESSDKIEVARKLLLQMYDVHDAAHFLHAIFGENRQEVMRFEWDSNYLLKPLLGCPNGYYLLDLAKDLHRKCLLKLSEINSIEMDRRKSQSQLAYGRTGDLSQHGNYSCFRNELFNGKPVILTAAFMNPMPITGKLEFDFSSTARPPKDLLPISDRKLLKMLLHHHLLDPKDVGVALFKLEEMKQFNQTSLLCKGLNYFECPPTRARQIALHMETFYAQLENRAALTQETRDKICKPVIDGVEALPRDSYPMPLTISDYLTREEHKLHPIDHAVKEVTAFQSFSRSLDEGDVRKAMDPVDVQKFLRDEKNFNDRSPSKLWRDNDDDESEEENSPGRYEPFSPVLRPTQEEESNYNVFGGPLSPYRLSGTSTPIPPPLSFDASHGSSIRSMKILRSASEDEEKEEEDDIFVTADTAEAIDWVREYEMIKKAKLTNLHRMKSRRLKDMIRRLSFLQEKNFVIFPTTDIFLQRFLKELQSPTVQAGLKAHKLIDLLEETLCRNWLYCRQVSLLMECLVQYGYYKQTPYFGTYRVELLVTIFTRIIDIHNFELVLQVLSPFEAACVICRLGYLLVFNPCKPEGAWELDLARREERLIVKMLCMLGIYEPGNNFFHESFQWTRDTSVMPGWELTQSWLTEEGLPPRGILSFVYYSGEGKELNGCKPYVPFRKALLNLVLIEESDLVPEEARSRPRDPKKLTVGQRCFRKYISVWDNYFTPVTKENNYPISARKK